MIAAYPRIRQTVVQACSARNRIPALGRVPDWLGLLVGGDDLQKTTTGVTPRGLDFTNEPLNSAA